MKLAIPRSDLADLIGKGGTTAERVSTIPILKHVRLIARNNQLRVSTTNLNMQAEAVGAAAIETEGETTVDAEKLKSLVDRLPRAAEISLALDGADLIVKAGRSRSRLPTLPVHDWPNLDMQLGPEAAIFTVTGAELDRLLTRTIAIASLSDATRPNLQSILLHHREWKDVAALCAVATNGHAFLLTSVEAPAGAEDLPENAGERGILVSSETAGAALRLFRGDPSIKITATAGRIIFNGTTATLASKLTELQYPDYRRIMPQPSENLIRIDRADASDRVNLLETFATKDQGHKLEALFDNNGLALASGGGSDGDGIAIVEAEADGSPQPFGLSSQYLKLMLGAFKAETLTVSIADPASPLVFTADNEIDTYGIVMPMRTSGHLTREKLNGAARD